MQYEKENGAVLVQRVSNVTVERKLYMTEDLEIRRTRKALLIMLGVVLVNISSFLYVVNKKINNKYFKIIQKLT